MGKHIREFYVSVDVEADGPCPGINSMLQLGAVFYDQNGKTLQEYGVNIFPIEGAIQNPETMKWWEKQEQKNPGLWDSMMQDRVPAKQAMEQFQNYVLYYGGQLRCSPLVVAYPNSYDFTFLYWYLNKFLGQSCVGFSSLDMKTLAMALINDTYHNASKKRWPKDWRNPELKHTHNALSDSKEQGYSFFMMLKSLKLLHTLHV